MVGPMHLGDPVASACRKGGPGAALDRVEIAADQLRNLMPQPIALVSFTAGALPDATASIAFLR